MPPYFFCSFSKPGFSDHAPNFLVLGDRLKSKKTFFGLPLPAPPSRLSPEDCYAVAGAVCGGYSNVFSLSEAKAFEEGNHGYQQRTLLNIEERVKEAHSTLVSYQNQILVDPTPLLAACEKETHRKWVTLALAEEWFLQQRSRVKWLESGDMNTSLFHRMVVSRRAVNKIHYLIDLAGNRLSTLVDIKNHCVAYYEDLFGAESPTLFLSTLDQIADLTSFRCTEKISSSSSSHC